MGYQIKVEPRNFIARKPLRIWKWLLVAISVHAAVPDPPENVQISTVNQNSVTVTWEPPTSNRTSISAYMVEWDPTPGTEEVQLIQTSTYTRANEVQSIQTRADDVNEVQQVSTSASVVAEVQTITTTATSGESIGGVFTVALDTRESGGSYQISGEIRYNALPDTDRSSLKQMLNSMSNVGPDGVTSVSRTGPDPQGGYQWSITFAVSMGDIPQLSLRSQTLTGSGAKVVIDTKTQGNVISSGLFTLRFRDTTTTDIKFDSTATEMQQKLASLNSIASVAVSRFGPDSQNGFKWRITFTSNAKNNGGPLPLIIVDNKTRFKALGATVSVQEVVRGNALGGSFKLTYNGATTDNIPYDADASTMQSKLGDLNLGSIDVSRTTAPDPQGGYTWTISFLSLQGITSSLGYDAARLTESRLTGASSELIKAKRVRRNTAQEVQQIQISTTSTTVASSTYYYLQVTNPTRGTTLSTGKIPADLTGTVSCNAARPEVQQVQIHTADTTAQGGDSIVSPNLQFQFIFRASGRYQEPQSTNFINITTNDGSGSCVTSALMIKEELENLPSLLGSVTVASGPDSATLECSWTITFHNQPGNIAPLQVQLRDRYRTLISSISGTLGDDTVTVVTIQDGTVDLIKSELENLANIVGSVNVAAVTPTNAQHACAWRITFLDTAGDLPLLQAAVGNTAFASSGTQGSDTVTVTEIIAGTSTPLGGSFALSLKGERTGYIPFDVSAMGLQNQLELLSAIMKPLRVSRLDADANNGFQWLITFLGNVGDVDKLIGDANNLTGTASSVQVTEIVKGIPPPFNARNNAGSFGSSLITTQNDFSWIATEMDENVPFYFRVFALNAAGRSFPAYSNPPFAIPQTRTFLSMSL